MISLDFEQIRNSNLDNEALIDVLEAIYISLTMNHGPSSRIIFNEYIDEISKQEDVVNGWVFELSNKPLSESDIKITTDSGTMILPTSINFLDNNRVGIISSALNSNSVLFVDYKY